MLTDPVREESITAAKVIVMCYSCLTPKMILKSGISFGYWMACLDSVSGSLRSRRSNRPKTNSPKGKRYAY